MYAIGMLLTSAPTLSRITPDTAGVESNPFWPTHTRLTPFAADILIIICQLQDGYSLTTSFKKG